LSPRQNTDNLAVSVMNPAVQIAESPINSASGFGFLLGHVRNSDNEHFILILWETRPTPVSIQVQHWAIF